MKMESLTCPAGKENCPHIDRLMILEKEIKKLKKRLEIDTLTGLHTYAYFLDALANEMERTKRTGLPTTLVMMDLDHFKQINDAIGHEAGNLVLKEVGRIIRDNVRTLDIPCRYGGEEFAIILPATRLIQGIQLGERLRRLLKETRLQFKGKTITVTASLGINTFTPHSTWSMEDFIHATDEYLLKAKEAGRDRIESPMPRAMIETDVTQDERQALLGG